MNFELFKPFHPCLEYSNAFAAELLQAAHGLLRSLFYIKVCLGVEFVSIAYDLFLNALRCEILMRQRQVLTHNLGGRESRAGVPLSHAGMEG